MSGRLWTKQELQYLHAYYQEKPVKDIAKTLQRSYSSVQRKAQALGLTQPNPSQRKTWTEDEITFLLRYYETRGALYVAKHLDRTIASVKHKARKEGLNAYVNEFLSLTALADAFQCDQTVIHRWIEKFELPMKLLRFKSYQQYRIDAHHFWKWAAQHRDIIPWRTYQRYSILPEPKWLSYEIQQDFDNRHRQPISIYDINYVIRNHQNGMTFRSIAENLHRTEHSVKHIWRQHRPSPQKG